MQITGLDQELTDIYDEIIVDGPTQEAVTARKLIISSLVNDIQGEEQTGEEKFARYHIATIVKDANEDVNLTAEQIAKIKDRAGRMYATRVIGPLFQRLEGGDGA